MSSPDLTYLIAWNRNSMDVTKITALVNVRTYLSLHGPPQALTITISSSNFCENMFRQVYLNLGHMKPSSADNSLDKKTSYCLNHMTIGYVQLVRQTVHVACLDVRSSTFRL